MFSLIEFLLIQALVNLQRNRVMSTAAVATMALMLSIAGGFSILAWQLDGAARSLPSRFEMVVFLKDNVSNERIKAVSKKLKQSPHVLSVTFKSRNDAWLEYTKSLPKEVVQQLVDNPLPHSYVVRLADANDMAKVSSWISSLPEVEVVNDGRADVRLILKVAKWIRWIGITLAVLLLAVTVFIVHNTIRIAIHARRREIRTMQLIGATSHTIRAPFLLEGIIQGLAGGLLSWLLLYGVADFTSKYTARTLPILRSLNAPEVSFGMVGLILAAIGCLIGLAVSVISVQRYLKEVG